MRQHLLMIDQGFAVQEMLWWPNEIFQTTLDIVVEEINQGRQSLLRLKNEKNTAFFSFFLFLILQFIRTEVIDV